MGFGRCAWLATLAGAVILGAALGCSTTSGTGGGGSGGAAATSVTSSTGAGSPASSTGSVAGTGGTAVASTSSSGAAGAGGAGGGEPSLTPSGYKCSGAKPTIEAVAAITSKNCAASLSCHPGMATPPEIYNSLVGVLTEECTDGRLFVKSKDPEHSYVINKITDHNLCGTGVPMPNGAAPLPSADIQTIYDWICTGAPDN